MNISKRLKNSDVFALSWECSVFLFGRWVFNLGENQSSNKRKKTSTPVEVQLKSEPKKSKYFPLFSWLQHASQVICRTNTVIFNLLSFSHAIVPKGKSFWTFYVCISYEECIKLLKPLRPLRFWWFLAQDKKY